jgi:hypothetical protein
MLVEQRISQIEFLRTSMQQRASSSTHAGVGHGAVQGPGYQALPPQKAVCSCDDQQLPWLSPNKQRHGMQLLARGDAPHVGGS